MDGSVRVLLVSAGASPDALVAELERLGVEITPCAFVDAEAYLETSPPDLVALAGALGAVELANMIDDLDDGPRMVIVAERKELAKLRGLNREVVVSLFAMETTEKVVGQRIESLARRAARRRDHKAADPVPVQKTSLGLPTGAHVGKVDLKKREAPPRTRSSAAVEETPPSSGSHPGAEPLTPEPSPNLQAGPKPPVAEDAKPESKAQAVPAVQKPPPPQRKPARSAKEEAEQSIMIIDAELLESILPDAPDGDIPEISTIPMLSAVPAPEDAPVSSPPTLPPAAKAQMGRLPQMKLAAPPGQLDIADAESALENLDSVKLEITQDLVEHAQKEMGSSKPNPEGATEDFKSVPQVTGEQKDGVVENATDHETIDASVESEETVIVDRKTADEQAVALDKTMTLADLDASLGGDEWAKPAAKSELVGSDLSGPELGGSDLHRNKDEEGARGASEDNALGASDSAGSRLLDGMGASTGEEVTTALPTVGTPTDSNSVEADAPPEGGEPAVAAKPSKKGGGLGALALAAVVTAVVGGVYGLQSGKLGGVGEKDISNSAPESASATPAPGPADGNEVEEQAPTSNGDGTSAQSEPEVVPAEDSVPSETAEPVSDGTSPLAAPFKRKDTNAITCAALLGSNAPEKGSDPVSEASQAWEKARAAIVGGKLEEAHRYMCEAVTINPESAAVEGLAAHYLALGSYAEALRWANKADELRPGQMDIGNLKGDVYAMMGDVEKARSTWLALLNIGPEESARLRPISKDYSVEAGRHLRRGDLIRAEIFFRRAVILDPENLNGIMGLAKVYHRMEMPAYARAFCEMALKVSEVIPEVHVLLGEMALAEGNKDEARVRFERALAVRPDFYPAKRGLTQVK